MAVSDWSTNPDMNGLVDPAIAAVDSAPARKYMPFLRQLMAGVAGLKAGTAAIGHKAAPDADYQALVTDTQIGFAVLSAPRTVFLPDVDAYPLGQVLFIADESGQCSVDRPITISVTAGTGDTIAGQQAIQITDAYQGIGLRRGAANVWIIAR
jgi:hypothetical protein